MEDQIHIPQGRRAVVARRVLEAVHRIIREEAGAVGSNREVCGGCTLIALEGATDLGERYARAQFERERPDQMLGSLARLFGRSPQTVRV